MPDDDDLDEFLREAEELESLQARRAPRAPSNPPRIEDLFNPGPPRIRTAEELARDFPGQRRNLKCPDCGAALVLKDGKYGIFYGCVKWDETQCKGAHNCNKMTAEPLGIPGDWETRQLRKQAHAVFDQLWQNQGLGLSRMQRKDAYRWMQQNLGLSESDAHIAMLDKAGCERLIRAVDRFFNPPTRFDRDEPI